MQKPKSLIGKGFAPPFVLFYFFYFPVLKTFAGLSSLLNYRESQFCWGTGNTFSPTEPWSCCCFFINISLVARCGAWQHSLLEILGCILKIWCIQILKSCVFLLCFAFLQLQLPLMCFTQLITSSGSQCFTGASTVCPDHPHSFWVFFSVSTFSTSQIYPWKISISFHSSSSEPQPYFWFMSLFSSFASLFLLYNQCNQFTFSEINCNPREIQS